MPSATVTGASGSVSTSISTPRNSHRLGLGVPGMSGCSADAELGEHLLTGRLVVVRPLGVFPDGRHQVVELVVGGDPELHPARAAEDAAAHGVAGRDEIDGDAWLIADHPGVVAGADQVGVARPELQLPAVVHHYVEPAGDNVGAVGELAAVGPDERFHVGGPPPAGPEVGPAHGEPGEIDQADLAMHEAPLVVRVGYVLGLQHEFSPSLCPDPSRERWDEDAPPGAPGASGRTRSVRGEHVAPDRAYVLGWRDVTASSVRERARVLRSRFSTCFSTVLGDRRRAAAISLLARPSMTRRSTSASRSVTPSPAHGLGEASRSSSAQRPASRPGPRAVNRSRAAVSQRTGSPQPSARAQGAAMNRARSAQASQLTNAVACPVMVASAWPGRPERPSSTAWAKAMRPRLMTKASTLSRRTSSRVAAARRSPCAAWIKGHSARIEIGSAWGSRDRAAVPSANGRSAAAVSPVMNRAMPMLARQNPASMGSAGPAASARAASRSEASVSARMLA